MESYQVLRDLAIIIICAKFFGIVAKKFKAPMVVGEIISGLIIGPCLLGWVEQTDFIKYLAEIGVILIMFSAGLETDLKELKKSGLKAFLIACMGVAVPLIGGTILYMCFYGFDGFGTEEFFKALFVGSIMTATSVGITVETLKEMGYLQGSTGQTILSAAIIDDVLGIIVLTFVIALKDPTANPVMITGKTVLFFALSIITGIVIYKIFKWLDARYPHTRRIPIIGLALCFAFAYLAEKYFGIADITGAYVAGIILCNVQDASYIDRKVTVSNYMIFGPMFFVSIGLKTDLSSLSSNMIWFSVGFVLVAMVTKIIGCGLMAKICKMKTSECIKVGFGMMTRGEVALIIAQKGLNLKIISSAFFTPVILLILVSSISVPILLKLMYHKYPEVNAAK
ncbi:MAG TPA: sodium:proton antiporter [Lachnospiraceae bacterium]|nr:sodium:proton antiporter [Lachnospiraceae bacterium]